MFVICIEIRILHVRISAKYDYAQMPPTKIETVDFIFVDRAKLSQSTVKAKLFKKYFVVRCVRPHAPDADNNSTKLAVLVTQVKTTTNNNNNQNRSYIGSVENISLQFAFGHQSCFRCSVWCERHRHSRWHAKQVTHVAPPRPTRRKNKSIQCWTWMWLISSFKIFVILWMATNAMSWCHMKSVALRLPDSGMQTWKQALAVFLHCITFRCDHFGIPCTAWTKVCIPHEFSWLCSVCFYPYGMFTLILISSHLDLMCPERQPTSTYLIYRNAKKLAITMSPNTMVSRLRQSAKSQ